MVVSARAAELKGSPTLAIAAKAKAMRAEGKDVLSLSAGEPDFDTPEHIKQAAVEAMRAGMTKYTPVSGIPELKAAVAESLKKSPGIEYGPAEILISCGAKHAIAQALTALVDKGDEVLSLAPFWVSYPVMARMAEGTPRILYADGEHALWNPEEARVTERGVGFKIAAKGLAQALNGKTKVVILNAPSNPAGCVYSESELEELGAVLAKFPRVWIVADEIYNALTYDAQAPSLLSVCPGLKDRTLIVNGVSKTYSMTGWRIGWAVGPAPVIGAMGNIQSQTTSNPTSIAQYAAVAALSSSQECVDLMRDEFAKRRRLIVELLNAIPGIECALPEGAFYVFPDCRGLAADRNVMKKLGLKGDSPSGFSWALAQHLLEKALVAGIPGAEFGLECHLRLSFAASAETISKAAGRISEAISSLRG